MSGTTPPSFKPSLIDQANVEYAAGQKNLADGNVDQALTWFRRAVLTDPKFVAAHMQVGLICRDKARLDKMYARYVYDSFYKAAGLDLANEDAHNQFVLAGSVAGRLDELLLIYEKWSAADPSNELLKKCKKNVATLGMALIPQAVGVGGSNNAGLKRFVTISSVLLFAVGLGMLTVVPMLVKAGKLSRQNVRGVAPVGGPSAAPGWGGVFYHRNL
jgi:tetratricopeptide (TPR) repeat protein